jgi:steroid 5-alpha reductase family enzyme
MTLATLIGTAFAQGLAMSLLMAGAWAVRRWTGNSGWIDVTWTFAVGLVGAISALIPIAGSELSSRQVLVAALVSVWSLRLSSHLALRTVGSGDDPRYAALALEWGEDAPKRMFRFAQIQAVVAIPLLMTIMLAAQSPSASLTLQDLLGAAMLVIAIIGEGIADAQLRAFKANRENRGKVCDIGLWSWSRHPNYFFQWLGWLAYPVIAIAPLGGYPWGWLTLVGPLCMYWLLVHVSGIPPLEEHMLRSRGDAFRKYQARTSAFFPWPRGAR